MTAETDQLMAKVRESDIQDLERDGAICLRGMFSQKWRDLIAEGIESDLKNPGPYGRTQSDPDDPGFFFTDYYMWRHVPELKRFAVEGPGGGIAAKLVRSKQVNYFFDGLFVKDPGTKKPTNWHQDQVYYNVNGNQIVVLWIPLDPVTKETCLSFVCGSHKWGKHFIPILIKGNKVPQGLGPEFEAAPDIESNRDQYDILSWDMQPGDCIAFHPMMLHGAAGNTMKIRRRALQSTWLGDDCVYGARQVEVEPRIEGRPFKNGERLTDPAIFPQVWPRTGAQA